MGLPSPLRLLLAWMITQVNTIAAVRNYSFEDLLPCTRTSLELSMELPDDSVEPCILYDINPNEGDNTTAVIPLVQVTPALCKDHRDGAAAAVEILNDEGVRIGFHQNYTVKFSLISIVAGNPTPSMAEEYQILHERLLRVLLERTGAHYIIGTCTLWAEAEKGPAADYQAMLMAQVGPPGFYLPETSNPYVFGFHIPSVDYPLQNVQELIFLQDKTIPIRLIYRNQPEFFSSTCESALKRLEDEGFTDIRSLPFDPTLDEDGDGEDNGLDVDYLEMLADLACPQNQSRLENPAIFVCTLTEHDIIIRRLLQTGCRPTSLWVTAATWSWADDNPNLRPFLQGGGQWHPKFDYSDEYFDSGKAFLEENQLRFGYPGSYDQVVSYAIPVLFSQHLQAAYRVTDAPDPLKDFADPQGCETLRRAMLVLNVNTIFGPVAFDEYQRNIGRGSAGTQWQLDDSAESGSVNRLVSPSLQAEAKTYIPADSARTCDAGSYVDIDSWSESGSILSGGCQLCPVDTFTLKPTTALQCTRCPEKSDTDGVVGSSRCNFYDDNLVTKGILGFGYATTIVSWALALGFLGWLFKHRKDPVVRVSQIEFLVLICLGTTVSSSSVIAWSMQAGTDEDTSRATAGCMAFPFLYTIGWTLQYSSLSAKTFRLFQTMVYSRRMERVSVTTTHTIRVVIVCLLIDLIIVTAWTIISPLEYVRTEEEPMINEELGRVTIRSVGRCQSTDGTFWYYAGPIIGFHLLLIIGTNLLLYQVRDIADRYQEQKYVAIASALMVEILLVGIPVMISVRDNVSATFIVLTAIVAIHDIAVLCCIFGPKVRFQRKGLEQGVNIGESILRETHRRATSRESWRRDSRSDGFSSSKFEVVRVDLGNGRNDATLDHKNQSSRPNRIVHSRDRQQSAFSRCSESIKEETSAEIRRELSGIDPSELRRQTSLAISPSMTLIESTLDGKRGDESRTSNHDENVPGEIQPSSRPPRNVSVSMVTHSGEVEEIQA